MLEHINELYRYNSWANQRIWGAAKNLSEEQFTAEGKFPHGGIRSTLIHEIFAEWLWRERMIGLSPNAEEIPLIFKGEDNPSYDELNDLWQAEELKMRKFLESFTDESLKENISYKTTKGDPHRETYLNILTHVVMHGMQHRTEAAQMLTEYGYSPGNIDFFVYLREKIN